MADINKENFKRISKDDWKDRIQTELFDTKDVNGKAWPQWKFKRWDNEVNYSIRLKEADNEEPVIVEEDEKTKWKKSKHEVHFYEKPVSSEHPNGAAKGIYGRQNYLPGSFEDHDRLKCQ
jgi:hypothetical protein